MLELIHIQHNTPEWLYYRRTGIGGSEAAAVIGISPFKNNVDLWEEKMGRKNAPDLSDNPRVKYGTDAEDPLFRLFALDNPQYDCKADKTVMYRRGFAFASLDGELTERETGRKGIYEGKTTEVRKRSELRKWDGKIPDYYYAQIVHNLMVTGWDFAVLKVQIKMMDGDSVKEIITRQYHFERKDMLLDMKHLYLHESKFWDGVVKGERPYLILPTV
jgi:putative phage-type endonuclease